MKYEAKLTFKGKLLLFVLTNPITRLLIWRTLQKKLFKLMKDSSVKSS